MRANIEAQLGRLLAQLSDLDELRAELDDAEYAETRRDTMEQIAEFDESLKRMLDGDMTLVSALGQIKLAAEAAIKNAFKSARSARRAYFSASAALARARVRHPLCLSPPFPPRTAPEVIAMFAKREPAALRGRLAKLSQELRLGHLAPGPFKVQAIEVILALKKLGEVVSVRRARARALSRRKPPPPPPPFPSRLARRPPPRSPRLYAQLTPEEADILNSASSEMRGQFETADKAIAEAAVLSMAGRSAK